MGIQTSVGVGEHPNLMLTDFPSLLDDAPAMAMKLNRHMQINDRHVSLYSSLFSMFESEENRGARERIKLS